MNTITEAQEDMRQGYANGVPGVLASGSVWIIAGLVAFLATPEAGMAALVVGGMFIFPLSLLLCKIIGYPGAHSKGNPLAPLALESTFWMLLSIPIAGGAALYQQGWFFPAMMLIIGGRYLTFSTLYGLRIYWLLALALVGAAVALAFVGPPIFLGGLVGGSVELAFALIIGKFSPRTTPRSRAA